MPELIERGHVFIAQPPLYGIKSGQKEFYIKDDQGLRAFTMSRYAEDRILTGEGSPIKLEGKALQDFLDSLIAERDFRERYGRVGFPARLWPILHQEIAKDPAGFSDLEWTRRLAETLEKSGLSASGPDFPDEAAEKPASDEEEANGDGQGQGYKLTMPAVHDNRKILTLNAAFQTGELFQKYQKLKDKASSFVQAPFSVQFKDRSYRLESEKELLEDMEAAGQKGLRVQRYKGLGEMNAPQLWETTMDPQRRTFLKVRIQDAMDADDIFTVLMGDQVEPRRDFIRENALNVRELDI
jgi:DNA gyrase subunit B